MKSFYDAIMIVSLHIPAHLWILYSFLVNGFVVSRILCARSSLYAELLKPLEATILSSFFLSLIINGMALLVCSTVGWDFSLLRFFLPIFSVIALALLRHELGKRKEGLFLTCPDFSRGRLLLYSLVFILLLINGGLIERLADSWWHLSLANKIALFSSFDQDLVAKHLNGITGRYYPPLWHGNLAMLHKISNISLPVLWNSFTAWGAVFKVMGFYLLALGLSNNKGMALLSALLFVLLPGLGDAYLRVSAWPSHIAYTAWFCMFYISFVFFDHYRPFGVAVKNGSISGLIRSWLGSARQNGALVISFIVLAIVVFFLHQAELLWFAAGMFFYACLLVFVRLFAVFQRDRVEPGMGFLRISVVGGVVCILFLTWQNYWPVVVNSSEWSDVHLLVALLLGISGALLYAVSEGSLVKCLYRKKIAILLFSLVTVCILFSIDVRQLLSLFSPELSYSQPAYHGAPIYCTGWLGGSLMLPDWSMQLRQGLLYSGVLAVVVSVGMVCVEPKRGTIFLAANSIGPFLFLVSPYLYHWLMGVLHYESSWRLALLIFHPIVLAYCLLYLWGKIVAGWCKP